MRRFRMWLARFPGMFWIAPKIRGEDIALAPKFPRGDWFLLDSEGQIRKAEPPKGDV